MTIQLRLGSYEQNAVNDEDKGVLEKVDREETRIREQVKDLVAVLRAGNFSLARQLITESKLEEQVFPLVRALDYLQTGDEALIEKLSPEVRGIVEEVVAKLKTAAPPSKS